MAHFSLPPLNALRAFEAAARLGSFRGAADELNVTHPIIGRHIRNLELRLKVRLFERAGRGVCLTEVGRLYLSHISKAFADISSATEDISPQASPHWLRIIVAPAFSTRWLAPRITDLQKIMPKLKITLEPGLNLDPIAQGEADLGIGSGEMDQFDGNVTRLAHPEVFPVCSRSFIDEFGPISDLAALQKAKLLHEDHGLWWSSWFSAHGVFYRSQHQISYANADQAIEMAIAGRGIALANHFLVHAELADQTLVRPLREAVRLENYIAVTRSRSPNPRLKPLMDWLLAELTTFEQALANPAN